LPDEKLQNRARSVAAVLVLLVASVLLARTLGLGSVLVVASTFVGAKSGE
jgi:hypothetical protein